MLSKLELKRQLMHILVGLVTITLIYYNILSPFALLLLIIIGIMLSFLCKRVRIPIISTFLDHVERDEQRRKFPGKGTIFFFIGVLLSLQLFERNIAYASIMILTLGDSISHMFGAQFGKIKNIFNGKSQKLLEGTLAGTLAGFFGALFFVPIPEAFLGSLGAMIAEVIKIDFNENTLDDNLVVPLIAGTVMVLVGKFV
ncbi:MAG: SEC59/DGK1/VTE5 family protein [Nanoarchaeota archaeon]|nr:SEC59/DGK1/VTE5 family protein [Nanoarchaeota archaeon]